MLRAQSAWLIEQFSAFLAVGILPSSHTFFMIVFRIFIYFQEISSGIMFFQLLIATVNIWASLFRLLMVLNSILNWIESTYLLWLFFFLIVIFHPNYWKNWLWNHSIFIIRSGTACQLKYRNWFCYFWSVHQDIANYLDLE